MKKKVCFLIPSLRGGGAERVISTLLNHLDKEKFELYLVLINSSNNVYSDDIPAHVTLINLESTRVRYSFVKVYKVLKKLKPEIAFSTLGYLNIAIGLLKPFLPQKTVYIARESNTVSKVLENKKLSFWWGLAYRTIYRNFDVIVCQSKDMFRDLHLNFGIPKNKMIIINNPVDIERVRKLSKVNKEDLFDKSKKNLVAAGRLAHQKGFDILLKALAINDDDSLQLHILGKGKKENKLKELTIKLNIKDRVHFLGFIDNPYPYFAQADVFVLSSRFEGFPNVLLEALACGTPVIANPCPGGIDEILSNIEECAIAGEINEDALAEEFKRFNYGYKLDKKVVDSWSVDGITRKYEQLFMKGNFKINK